MLRALAFLPLAFFHGLGKVLGWLIWLVSPRFRRLTRENLSLAGYSGHALLRQAIGEMGKSVAEIVPVWFRPQARAASLLQVDGDVRQLLDAVAAEERGIVFVTPHLGCFEVTAQWYAQYRGPMTALFSPPKKGIVDYLIRHGRKRGNLRLAAPGMRGLRSLYRALKAGEAIGILPDQVPGAGEGEWVDFFGRPAYTMTLVDRLASATGAPIVIAYAERLPGGRGFRAHAQRLPAAPPGMSPQRHLNVALEDIIRQCPAQYLWSYNRYKVPAGVTAPVRT